MNAQQPATSLNTAEEREGPIAIAWPDGDVWRWKYTVTHTEHAIVINQQGWVICKSPTPTKIAAKWHDKQARGCSEIADDEPRIAIDIRERARVAAIHHRASAAGLRLAAADIRRKAICRDRVS